MKSRLAGNLHRAARIFYKNEGKNKVSYFISDSQRLRIGRKNIIFRSPQVIAGAALLVLASAGSGAYLLNKSSTSKAATIERPWSLTGSGSGFGANLGWNFAHNGVNIQATNNVGENLKLQYAAGTTSSQGLHGCWRFPVPANVRVNTVKFRLAANSAGANQAVIGIQNSAGYFEPFVSGSPLSGGEALDYYNLNVSPGSVIQVCNRVTEDGNPATPSTTFQASRYVYVKEYQFSGTETVTISDPYFYGVTSVQNPPATLYVGQSADVVYQVRNDGTETWYGEGYTNSVRLGTWNPADRASPLYPNDGSWLFNGRIRMQESVVAPGQTATFKFRVTARTQGQFTEYFNLVKEGIAWFPSRGIQFTVNVPPPTYTYEPVSAVNPPATMTEGQRANVSIRVKNTGQYVWLGEGSPNPVRLGTSSPNDRVSGFAVVGQGWVSFNRIKLANPPVYPGQEAIFNFTVEAPTVPYIADNVQDFIKVTERFNVIAEGKAWMPERGIFFEINTQGELADANGTACLLSNFFTGLTTSSSPLKQAESTSVKSGSTGIVTDNSRPPSCKTLALYSDESYVEETLTVAKGGLYEVIFAAKGRTYQDVRAEITYRLTVIEPGKAALAGAANYRYLENNEWNEHIALSPKTNNGRAYYPAGTQLKLRITFKNDLSSRDAFVDYFKLNAVDTDVWKPNSTAYRRTIAEENSQAETDVNRFEVVYLVPSGGKDRKFDTNGAIRTSLSTMNSWLKQRTGKSVRFDQYNGKIDITYYQLSGTAAYYATDPDTSFRRIYAEVSKRFTDRRASYIFYVEADLNKINLGKNAVCGLASGRKYAFHFLYPSTGICDNSLFSTGEFRRPETVTLHEIIHTANHVCKKAPNYTAIGGGHVTLGPDLMSPNGGYDFDADRNDYLGGACSSLLTAPFLQ